LRDFKAEKGNTKNTTTKEEQEKKMSLTKWKEIFKSSRQPRGTRIPKHEEGCSVEKKKKGGERTYRGAKQTRVPKKRGLVGGRPERKRYIEGSVGESNTNRDEGKIGKERGRDRRLIGVGGQTANGEIGRETMTHYKRGFRKRGVIPGNNGEERREGEKKTQFLEGKNLRPQRGKKNKLD